MCASLCCLSVGLICLSDAVLFFLLHVVLSLHVWRSSCLVKVEIFAEYDGIIISCWSTAFSWSTNVIFTLVRGHLPLICLLGKRSRTATQLPHAFASSQSAAAICGWCWDWRERRWRESRLVRRNLRASAGGHAAGRESADRADWEPAEREVNTAPKICVCK